MNAGRELDALIAERVLGHRLLYVARAWSGEDWMGSDTPTECNVMAIVNPEPNRFCPQYQVIPPYSTDIAAAWDVVEMITRPPTTLEAAERAANTRFGLWWNDAALWATSAPEAAHAICLAALKAVGVEL